MKLCEKCMKVAWLSTKVGENRYPRPVRDVVHRGSRDLVHRAVSGPAAAPPGCPRLAWMGLWTSLGHYAAAQSARGLQRHGCFLSRAGEVMHAAGGCPCGQPLETSLQPSIGGPWRGLAIFCTGLPSPLWKSPDLAVLHRRILCTRLVDQGVDKLRAHRCRHRLAWPAGVWLNSDQGLLAVFAGSFPPLRGISLWISSGWIARPRQPRASGAVWRFFVQSAGGRLYTVVVRHPVDNLGAILCRPRLARPAGMWSKNDQAGRGLRRRPRKLSRLNTSRPSQMQAKASSWASCRGSPYSSTASSSTRVGARYCRKPRVA